jgi:hypothetical protein
MATSAGVARTVPPRLSAFRLLTFYRAPGRTEPNGGPTAAAKRDAALPGLTFVPPYRQDSGARASRERIGMPRWHAARPNRFPFWHFRMDVE